MGGGGWWWWTGQTHFMVGPGRGPTKRHQLEKNTPPPVVAVVINTELCMCALHNVHIECKINQTGVWVKTCTSCIVTSATRNVKTT